MSEVECEGLQQSMQFAWQPFLSLLSGLYINTPTKGLDTQHSVQNRF